jgi:hypothetical protein
MVGLALFAAVGGFVVYSSFQLDTVTCEVCMEYRGNSQCRSVGGETQKEAQGGAIVNACAFISGGVTDRMACERATPTSVRCW